MFFLSIAIVLSLGTTNTLIAQVLPTNHTMKNLKLGNIFFYHYQSWDTRGVTLVQDFYFYDKVVRYDTIMSKVYAVFQNGVRERADSSGVYWMPVKRDSGLFSKEYLRYPFSPIPTEAFSILYCGISFMLSRCYLENDPIYKPTLARVIPDSDTNFLFFGKKVKNYFLFGINDARYTTIFGPWYSIRPENQGRHITTLCGALIEGKYYGDSACLVASSSPLQAADFTTLSPSLAPNPVSDIATLRFILPTAQGVTIEICDMLGREVSPPLRFDALSSGMNALPIDVTGMARGVYTMRLRTALGLTATTMMVKE